MNKIGTWFTPNLPLLTAAAIFAGVVLRIAGIATSAIWYDEAFSLYLIRLSPVQMVQAAGLDFNPPLWELTAWPFIHAFGESELALRLPALLCSLVALWLTWKLTKEFQLTPGQTLAAMTLASLLPYQIWMAQDGRCYTLLEALFLGAVWFAMRQRWLGLLACAGLLLYSHSTGAFYALTAVTIAILRSLIVTQSVDADAAQSQRDRPGNWITWLVTKLGFAWTWPVVGNRYFLVGLGALVLFLPWLPAYIHANSLSFWHNPLTIGSLIFALLASWWAGSLNASPLLALFVIVLSLCVLGAMIFSLAEPIQNKTFRSNPLPILALAALGPAVLMLFASVTYKNMIFYRTLSPLVLPICLWLAATITPRRLTLTTWFLPYAWTLLLLAGLVGWSPADRGGDLRAEADFIASHFQSGDVIYHATGTSYLPFGIYLKGEENQTYLLNENQDDGLLQTDLQNIFGLNRAALETIPHRRAWIIWARDLSMTPAAQKRMAQYTQGATLIGVVRGMQFADIEIYLQEN